MREGDQFHRFQPGGAVGGKIGIMLLYLPLLVCLIGLLMYVLASNPKINEVGRMMFWCGLLAFLLMGERLVQLLPTR